MAVGTTLSSREENRSNGAEKSYTFGGGGGGGAGVGRNGLGKAGR